MRTSSRGARLILVAIVLLLTARAGSARAATHMGLEALTDFPVQVGGKVWFELPLHFRINTSLGYMPGAYIGAWNAVLVGTGRYSQETGDLARTALDSALVWRIHVGWRPFLGLYFDVGYGLAALGGGLATADLVANVAGMAAPQDPSSLQGYHARTLLHMADAEIGYQWTLWRITLRTALGLAATFAESTSINPAFHAAQPDAQSAFTRAAATHLDATYRSYFFMPVFSVAAGIKLF
jgi:hypothetical protein